MTRVGTAILLAGHALVRVREVERSLRRGGLVARVDEPYAHGVVREQELVLAPHVQIVCVVGKGPFERGEESIAELAAVDQRIERGALHGVALDVPFAHERRDTVGGSVACARIEDVHASCFEETELILQIDPVR